MYFRFLYVFVFCQLLGFSQPLETVIQKGHRRNVMTVQLSHNGKLLASGSRDKSIIIWDVATKRQMRTLNGHEGSVLQVVFSQDDQYIASVSGDMTLRIWEVKSGEIIYQLDKQEDYLTTVALHPTEKTLAVGGYPFEFKIIDYQNGKVLKQIPCSPDKGMGMGLSLVYSADGKYLAVGEDNKEARLFETKNYDEVFKMPNTYGSCGGCGTVVAFSPDQKFIAKLAHNDTLKLYDLQKQNIIAKLGKINDKVAGMQFSKNSEKVYAVTDDTLRIFSVASQQLMKEIDLKKFKLGDLNQITVAEDEFLVYLATTSGVIAGIDLRSGEMTAQFAGINNFTDKGGIDYDPESYWDSYIAKYMYLKNYFITLNNDRSFLTGKMGKDAIQWNLITGEPEKFFGSNEKAIVCFDQLPAQNLLVLGDAAGQISIWDLHKHKLIKQIKAHREPIFNVKINEAQNQIIASSWDATISIWDLKTHEKIKQINLSPNYSAFSFSHVKNGLYLALGKLDKTLLLMEPDSKEVVRSFVGHSDVVSSIVENISSGEILTASWDGTARVWDINSGLTTLKIKVPGSLYTAIYHNDYSKFYTAGSDATIRIWESKSGKLLKTLKGHQAEITQLQLSKDGKYLFSMSLDGTLKYWRLDTGEELYEHIRLSAKDWMVKSPTGYFNATQGARGRISFVKGTEMYKPDQFFDKYYRPDLLEKLFNNKIRLGSLEEDLEKSYTEDIKLAISPDADGKTATLYLKIPQQNIQLLHEIKISHNGKKLPYKINHESDSSRSIHKTIKLTVHLISGMNVFSIHPVSKNKLESKAQDIKYFAEKAIHETNCHIFSIGINAYENSSMQLRYARADAEAFVGKYKEYATSLYKNIYVHGLYDQAATRRNILDTLEKLTQTVGVNDVFVFYYAGHGSMLSDMFYLIPQNCQRLYDDEKLGTQAISAKELQELFKKIKALKQVVILDACQSEGGISTLAMRGSNEEKAMAQLSRSAGVHIFASAGSEQSAKEIEELKHGLFTYVLLNALDGAADGSPKDNKVTVFELKSYLDDQVPELNRLYSGKMQYPYTFSLGQDFPLIYFK